MNMEKNYHKYYNYHLYLVPTDESTCSSESKAEPQNESVPHEIFFAKEKKNILVSLGKLSTFDFFKKIMRSMFTNSAIILSR